MRIVVRPIRENNRQVFRGLFWQLIVQRLYYNDRKRGLKIRNEFFSWPPNVFFLDCRDDQIRLWDKFWAISVFYHIFEKIRKGAKSGQKVCTACKPGLKFFKKRSRISMSLKICQRAWFDLLYNLSKNIWGSGKNSFLIFRPKKQKF